MPIGAHQRSLAPGTSVHPGRAKRTDVGGGPGNPLRDLQRHYGNQALLRAFGGDSVQRAPEPAARRGKEPCRCGGTCAGCRTGHGSDVDAGLKPTAPLPDPGTHLGRLILGEPAADSLGVDPPEQTDSGAVEAEGLQEAVRRDETLVGRQLPGSPQGSGQPTPAQQPQQNTAGCSGCRVCFSGIRYRVPIASLDSHQVGTPYADMELHARNFLNSNRLRRQANLTAPAQTSSGPFKYTNTAGPGMPSGMFTAGHFLFFMDWEICETARNPCILRQSETITVTRDGQAPRTTTARPVTPSLGNAWTKAPRRNPVAGCDKTLVWVDAPGDIAITSGPSAQGFSENVSQTIEILDGGTNRVVDSVTESFSIGVDAAGNLSASP